MVIKCEFCYVTFLSDPKYACNALNLNVKTMDRLITEVKGENLEGMDDKDVTEFFIYEQHCPYLPFNLEDHFPNLDYLLVFDSNLRELKKSDIQGLTKLTFLEIDFNPIQEIRKDLFDGNPLLEVVSFFGCRLKFIEDGILSPLINLKQFYFNYNICINVPSVPDKFDFEELKIALKACSEPKNKVQSKLTKISTFK